jgi:hypothetical protein
MLKKALLLEKERPGLKRVLKKGMWSEMRKARG